MHITNAITGVTYATKVFRSFAEPSEFCAWVYQANVLGEPVIWFHIFTCRHKARRSAIATARAYGEAVPC
jgi:hypothetical protein